MQGIHLPLTARPQEIEAAIHEHGYVVVDDAVPIALVEQVQEDMRPFVEATPFGGDDAFGRKTKRTGRLIARSPAARELIMNSTVLNGVRAFFRKSSNIQLNTTQMVSVWPGNRPQPLHRDESAWDFFQWPQDYHVMLNAMWAITDSTEEMGATVYVPGGHLQPPHEPDKSKTVPVEMRRGSVLILGGKLYHGTGANRSDRVRQLLALTYSVGWVRQAENQYLAVPPEMARSLPADLLKLMGYELGCMGIGYVGDYEDPMSVIDPSRAVSHEELTKTANRYGALSQTANSIDAKYMVEEAQ